ncbi:MAG TPA: hypothetical protein PKI51_05935 [Anaerolineaceae bacterium]|nr:hypothetical protein [Anaerolineaceae bacterium]
MGYVILLLIMFGPFIIFLVYVYFKRKSNIEEREKTISTFKESFFSKGYKITREFSCSAPVYGTVMKVFIDSNKGVLAIVSGPPTRPIILSFDELAGCDVIVNRHAYISTKNLKLYIDNFNYRNYNVIPIISNNDFITEIIIKEFEVYIRTLNPNNPQIEVLKLKKPMNQEIPGLNELIVFAAELKTTVDNIANLHGKKCY